MARYQAQFTWAVISLLLGEGEMRGWRQQGKQHAGKCVLRQLVARGEVGEIVRGEITRLDCTYTAIMKRLKG